MRSPQLPSSDSPSKKEEKGSQQQIIKDSDKSASLVKVTWSTYKEYFSYSNCGLWSFFLLIFYHFIINLNSIVVGLYLAFTLSQRFSDDDKVAITSDKYYEVVLLLIMVSSVVTSFGGKYLSNKIVSRKLINTMSVV